MTRTQNARAAAVALIVAAACSSGDGDAGTTTAPGATRGDTSTTSPVQDVMEVEPFSPLEPGAYSIDPDLDATTPLRVHYDVAADGWSSWIGAAKLGSDGHVGVSITTVTNVVRHGCSDHAWVDPPIGPAVEDLVAALVELQPFTVTSPPEDVTLAGHPGTYLELTVPELPTEHAGDEVTFTGCVDGAVKGWVAAIDTEPGDAFYGYTGPGYTEQFWILDVDGTRLVIIAGRSPESAAEDVEEMRAILDSIRINV